MVNCHVVAGTEPQIAIFSISLNTPNGNTPNEKQANCTLFQYQYHLEYKIWEIQN